MSQEAVRASQDAPREGGASATAVMATAAAATISPGAPSAERPSELPESRRFAA